MLSNRARGQTHLKKLVRFFGLHANAGRDPKKLTVISKGIHSVMKEIKDSNGSASESKLSELESFIGSSAPEQIDIFPPK